MMTNFDAFSDEPPELDYAPESLIAGRIKRGSGIGKGEAIRRAKKYAWWQDDLTYDGRCKRWHVFRKPAY